MGSLQNYNGTVSRGAKKGSSGVEKPIGIYPGQYYDAETGTHYNYFRDYNPQVGRYLEVDPIGLEEGTNHLYTYTTNPVNLTDPEGLCPAVLPAIPAILAAIGEALAYAGAALTGAAAGQWLCECKKDREENCDEEWRNARKRCRQLIYELMEQRAGRKKKRSVTGVTGGFTDVEKCARGLVSERCGGNRVSR